MAKQLDMVSYPTGEQPKDETNSPPKDKNQQVEDKEDRQTESSHTPKDEDNLKVQEAHQKGSGELAGQEGAAGEGAPPAVQQQQPLED